MATLLSLPFLHNFMQYLTKPNKEVEKAVKAHLRRQKRREAEADSESDEADEVID